MPTSYRRTRRSGGGCPAVLTPGQYTHHPKCPHLIATLQKVVDEVAMPMWMPGPCSGTTPILIRGPGGPRAGAAVAPAPQVEVYPTPYGTVVQVVVPRVIYETVHALGYHHLGVLYTADHRVLQERTLKERAPARKGIPGLQAWLARHAAVLVPLLREPPPRWQAAPKGWIPAAVPACGRTWSLAAGRPKPPARRQCTTGGCPSGLPRPCRTPWKWKNGSRN